MSDRVPDELRFRSLAAPGLDEDDIFLAMWGLPGRGALWGEGRPAARPEGDDPWDEAAERRRRHEDLMRKWGSGGGSPSATSPPI